MKDIVLRSNLLVLGLQSHRIKDKSWLSPRSRSCSAPPRMQIFRLMYSDQHSGCWPGSKNCRPESSTIMDVSPDPALWQCAKASLIARLLTNMSRSCVTLCLLTSPHCVCELQFSMCVYRMMSMRPVNSGSGCRCTGQRALFASFAKDEMQRGWPSPRAGFSKRHNASSPATQ